MKINLTVCGFEKVQLSNTSKSIKATYEVFRNIEGTVSEVVEPLSAYAKKFTVSSQSCPIVAYRLIRRDEDNNFVPYGGPVIQIMEPSKSLKL